MTISISVSNSGDKTYTIQKGIALPKSIKRTSDPAKAKYNFNEMSHLDFFRVETVKEKNAIVQAIQSDRYASARERGHLTTRDISKNKDLQKACGFTDGFGIWFEEWTPEELAERAAKAAK